MRHDYSVDGFRFRIRPIEIKDASFVVKLRNDPELSKYLHRGAQDEASQRAWIEQYYARENDYYFVVEHLSNREPEGLVAVYDIDGDEDTAEWGRWILVNGSLAAVESCWLVYKFAFDVIDLGSVYCRTVGENESVVSFHDSTGATRVRNIPGHFSIDGRVFDAVEHRVDKANWPTINQKLQFLAQRLAKKYSHD